VSKPSTENPRASNDDLARLKRLLIAEHPCVRVNTLEEEYVLDLIEQAAEEHAMGVWLWSAVRGLRTLPNQGAQHIAETENAAAALYHISEKFSVPLVCVFFDLSSHLDDPRTLRALREAASTMRETGGTLILIDHLDDWPDVVTTFATTMEISLPDEVELESIITQTLQRLHKQRAVDVDLTRGQLRTIVNNLRGLTRRKAEQIIVDVVASDRRLDAEDINSVLAGKRQQLHMDGLLEYIEAPVDLDQVGGLHRLKQWLRNREKSYEAKAREFGLRPPRGVLLLGVQGAGKSLSAKAVATAWQQPLLRLDPGRLYNRYIGESERRLRQALHQAEMMSPVVLWIDEIEKGFASAASHSNDGGLSQRMFGTLLSWMQEHDEPVFLVATANDIEALPPELLRKGRFDEIFFVDLPGPEARRQIFRIHLKRRDRDPEQYNLDALVEASDGYSGAEIEQAIISALHRAFSEQRKMESKDIVAALAGSPPLSVTMREKIARLHEWATGRCVPAG